MNTTRMLILIGLCTLVSAGCVSVPPMAGSPALGKWVATGPDADDSPVTMQFKADGTFIAKVEEEVVTGIFMTNVNSISGRISGGENTFSGTIKGNTMEVVDSDGNKETFTRK